jgi:DNA helicase-2/ATP-dependent DNA helicase PcrA
MVFKKILGGPGCGKTYCLKENYQDFLCQCYKPEEITVLTFRKNTANDLINAIKPYTKLDEKALKDHVGTIHSICLRLLGSPGVISNDDLKCFVDINNFHDLVKKGNNADDSAHSGNLFDLYTWLKNTCTSYKDWGKYPGANKIMVSSTQVMNFLEMYDKFKKLMGRIDYSDMLQNIIDQKIPLDTPALMVDEFQDLTAQMNQVFELWSSKCEHVIIAGDPNQSIYGFWGGSPNYFNQWNAEEVILDETFRLPAQIKDFSHDLLKCHKMTQPEIKAVRANSQVIFRVPYYSDLPSFPSELHLIRCNYQASAIAMKLAVEGKVFSAPFYGWKSKEIDAANAIICARTGQETTPAYNRELMEFYQPSDGHIFDRIRSGNIFDGMISTNKLLRAKFYGIMNRTCLITPEEVQNRRILTIHGAKGLEADAVFLHMSITTEIRKAILMPGEEQRAEARVWYVGITRAKKVLYLIDDVGYSYPMMNVANYA